MDVTRADSACTPGAGIVRIHPRRPHKSPDNTAAEALALRLKALTDPGAPASAADACVQPSSAGSHSLGSGSGYF